jgi:hypothetical protein
MNENAEFLTLNVSEMKIQHLLVNYKMNTINKNKGKSLTFCLILQKRQQGCIHWWILLEGNNI